MAQILSAIGGTAPYVWSPVDVLPAGLSLSSAGTISGTPTTPTPGGYYTVQVQDALGVTATIALWVEVVAIAFPIAPVAEVLKRSAGIAVEMAVSIITPELTIFAVVPEMEVTIALVVGTDVVGAVIPEMDVAIASIPVLSVSLSVAPEMTVAIEDQVIAVTGAIVPEMAVEITAAAASTDPAAYWNLTSNGNAAIGTPNLTAGSGVSFASGAYAALDGSSNATLTGADTADISVGNAPFTWCTWIYLNSNSTCFLLQKGLGGLGGDYTGAIFEYIIFYDASAGRFKALLYDSTSTNSSSFAAVTASTFGAPSTGAWHFLTFYYRPGTPNNEIGISVNNGGFDTVATTIAHLDTAQNLTLGYRSQDGLNLPGRMRQTGFWLGLPTAIGGTVDLDYYYNPPDGRSL